MCPDRAYRGMTAEVHGVKRPALPKSEHANTARISVLLPLMLGAVSKKSPLKSKELGTASPRGSQYGTRSRTCAENVKYGIQIGYTHM